jgi:hypothetical protein
MHAPRGAEPWAPPQGCWGVGIDRAAPRPAQGPGPPGDIHALKFGLKLLLGWIEFQTNT